MRLSRVNLQHKIGIVFKNLFLTLFTLSSIYASVLFIFIIKEPTFFVPVELTGNEIPIRSDTYGDGFFGAKRKNGRIHVGIDIEATFGSPVYAVRSGLAICKDLRSGYGKLITIYHIDCSQSRYGHLSKFNISKFKWVKQRDIIGFVGRTGNARHKGIKSHLHFEIRKANKAVDPMKYLKMGG